MRAAFEAAIDRNAINQVVYNGEFLAGNQWVNPKNPNYVAEYPIPKRDVAKAKALLAEAGKPNPQITLTVYANSESPQVGQVIQAMTKEAGFDVKLQAWTSPRRSMPPTRAITRRSSIPGAAARTRTATRSASCSARRR